MSQHGACVRITREPERLTVVGTAAGTARAQCRRFGEKFISDSMLLAVEMILLVWRKVLLPCKSVLLPSEEALLPRKLVLLLSKMALLPSKRLLGCKRILLTNNNFLLPSKTLLLCFKAAKQTDSATKLRRFRDKQCPKTIKNRDGLVKRRCDLRNAIGEALWKTWTRSDKCGCPKNRCLGAHPPWVSQNASRPAGTIPPNEAPVAQDSA